MTFRQSTSPGCLLSGLELVVYVAQSVRVCPLPDRGTLTLGRSPQCDLQIEDPAISRQHLRFSVGEAVWVEDLDSTNGTSFVPACERRSGRPASEGRQLVPHQQVPMVPGDSVRLGTTVVVLEHRAPVAAQATLRPSGENLSAQGDLWWPTVLVNRQLRRLYELAALAASTDISVLILGETGVGKEVFAEFIHRRSQRAAKPFLRLNCAAISESLLESELFGHEKGAFTGAVGSKEGLLESTNGGTVLLDEIGELPRPLQVKLLRVLEERVVRRVGSNKPRPIDVRFIAATNRDLKRESMRGTFRDDLYFRINGASFSIPPLRERKDEIEPLASYFLEQACTRSARRVPSITSEARQYMLEYGWWGNVRELKNAMERASFLCENGPLLPEHLPNDPSPEDEPMDAEPTAAHDRFALSESPSASPSPFCSTSGLRPSQREWAVQRSLLPPPHSGPPISTPLPSCPATGTPMASCVDGDHEGLVAVDPEHQRILLALRECGGNQTRAARLLGMSRRTLINRLNEYGLPRPRKGRDLPPTK